MTSCCCFFSGCFFLPLQRDGGCGSHRERYFLQYEIADAYRVAHLPGLKQRIDSCVNDQIVGIALYDLPEFLFANTGANF